MSKKQSLENPKIDKFINDILKVCEKHKMSIGHEDSYGGFIIHKFNEAYSTWLIHAHDDTN